MLRSLKELQNYVLEATDGEIGRCKDFLFDDTEWIIRYMVADTRKWLPGRKVLIPPESLAKPDWLRKRLSVELSQQQIKESPPLETDQPVSRQYESRWTEYYGLPRYWLGPGGLGAIYSPMVPSAEEQKARLKNDIESPEGQLRSTQEVTGYHIQATDGEIGHVDDFFADDQDWTLHYLVVDTRNWLPGRKVLVSPQWASAVNWSERKVYFERSKEKIENSPEYDPAQLPNRKYEDLLYNYYGIPPYWKRE
jgi:hypothetical protein